MNASRQTRPGGQVGAAPAWMPWAAERFSSAVYTDIDSKADHNPLWDNKAD